VKDENNDEADILITISSVVLCFYDDDGGDNLCVRISVQIVSNSSADKRDFFGGDLSFFVFLSKITCDRPSVMKIIKRVVDEFIR
jgi:hypothetical protein